MNIAALLSPTVAALHKGAIGKGAGQPDGAFAALFAIGTVAGSDGTALPTTPMPTLPAAMPALQAVAAPADALPVADPGPATALPVEQPGPSLIPTPTIATPLLTESPAPRAKTPQHPLLATATAIEPQPTSPTPPPRLAVALASTALTPVVVPASKDDAPAYERETTEADDQPDTDEPIAPIAAALAAVNVTTPMPIAVLLDAPRPAAPAIVGWRAASPAAAIAATPSLVLTQAPATSQPATPAAAAPNPVPTAIEPPLPTLPPLARTTGDPAQPLPAIAAVDTPPVLTVSSTQTTIAAPTGRTADGPVPVMAQAPQPVADPAPITSGPALQVFGAAIAASRETSRADPGDPATAAAPAATAIAAATPAIVPTGDAQQAPLDLTQHRWPHAMIERIEQVRDLADAADTRIRLIPDALGTIDVTVRKDGDTLHVHFTADQAQTRALIQEAQPRLAAAAEERGLRLGQTGVDGGTAGHPQQQQPQGQRGATPQHNRAPNRAPTTTDTDPADDGRLA